MRLQGGGMMVKKYEHNKIIEYYLEGNYQAETCKKFGIGRKALHTIFKNNKIKIRPSNLKGEKAHGWKGGKVDDGYGRLLIYSPHHPRTIRSGVYVYEHTLVMEKKLGRFLIKGEVVHHKDKINLIMTQKI